MGAQMGHLTPERAGFRPVRPRARVFGASEGAPENVSQIASGPATPRRQPTRGRGGRGCSKGWFEGTAADGHGSSSKAALPDVAQLPHRDPKGWRPAPYMTTGVSTSR